MEEAKKKKGILKYIYLAFALLINAFIIMHSSFDAATSVKWSSAFVSFFAQLFKGGSQVEIVEATDINFYELTNYKYNNVPSYNENEIVLGKNKLLEASILPSNATNKAINVVSSNPDVISIEQNKGRIYLNASSLGTSTIKASSASNPSLYKEFIYEVVEKKAPTDFVVSEKEIYKNELFVMPISLEDNDFYSYYDWDKLTINFDNNAFKKYDEKYYQALEVGNKTIQVEDRNINITVKDTAELIYPNMLGINGKDNLISYQSVQYNVIFEGENKSSLLWEVDSPLVNISSSGYLTVKEINEEKIINITAKCMLNPEIKVSKSITLKPAVITNLELLMESDGFFVSNSYYLADIGQQLWIGPRDNTGTILYSGFTVTNSNDEVAKVYIVGKSIYVDCVKDGRTHIEVSSKASPDVKCYLDLEVTNNGVINNGNYKSFSEFVRKSVGHFMLFLVSGVFSFLATYYFLKEKTKLKVWVVILIALGIGFFFAGLSEFIQYFVPSRFGSFIDVLVDFFGFVIGAGITYLIIFIIEKRKAKTLSK